MIKIKNLNVVLNKLRLKKQQIRSAIEKGLREGLRKYQDFVTFDMLSGRKRSNYGLRRVSGVAAGSLDVTTKIKKNLIIGNLTVARRAWYLKIHQGVNYNGPIPKRLYMYEKFRTKGRQFIDNRITINLQRLR